jgi:hypothetical protein
MISYKIDSMSMNQVKALIGKKLLTYQEQGSPFGI